MVFEAARRFLGIDRSQHKREVRNILNAHTEELNTLAEMVSLDIEESFGALSNIHRVPGHLGAEELAPDILPGIVSQLNPITTKAPEIGSPIDLIALHIVEKWGNPNAKADGLQRGILEGQVKSGLRAMQGKSEKK